MYLTEIWGKYVLEKYASGYRPVVGLCGYGNELLGSIKDMEFLACYLLKVCASWSY
jgi:hypothetical protein